MSKYKSLLAGLALLGWAGTVSAQNETDALRYSRTFLSGSARIQSIGGAQAAIGADVGSMAGNPAGLGLFRRSEFSLTPAYSSVNTSSRANGGPPDAGTQSNLNFPSIGIVIADRKDDATPGDWRSGVFGLGFHRTNHFHAEFNYEGTTAPPNSMVRSFYEMALRNNRTVDNLEDEFQPDGTQIYSLEGLAWATFLLDADDQGNLFPVPQAGTVQYGEQVLSRGAQNQFDLSYGASYRDRVFIGGSIGINTISFTQERDFREADTGSQSDFVNLRLSDEFTTRGAGVHARLGVIYRPSDAMRFGASLQTPTIYALNDNYRSRLSVNYSPGFFTDPNRTSIDFSTSPGQFDYRLTTPLRATFGAAYFIEKRGFVTADVEIVNYAGARLSSRDADGFFNVANNTISRNFTPTANIKLGGEARVEIFRFRAGYALFGDPTGGAQVYGSRSFLTGGAGIRMANFSLDLAVVHGRSTEPYSPYTLNNNQQPVVAFANRTTHSLLTVGMNF
jgi:long-subunit fatty acid transport protein